jgi:hypothetical protein
VNFDEMMLEEHGQDQFITEAEKRHDITYYGTGRLSTVRFHCRPVETDVRQELYLFRAHGNAEDR